MKSGFLPRRPENSLLTRFISVAAAGWRHFSVSLVIVILRVVTLVGKFALTFFIVQYIGLEAVGVYGLVTAASSLLPILFGSGMSSIVNRHIVDMPLKEALPHMATLMTYNVLIYAILVPLLVLAATIGLVDAKPHQALLIGLVLLSEHIGIDVHGQLIARHRIHSAHIVLFLRAGAWIPLYIVVGWQIPPYRTLDAMFLSWFVGSLIAWGVLAAYLLQERRWRYLSLNWPWLWESMRRGRPFFVSDITECGSLYLDRFVISLCLGLEMTGVYTFFWSLTNAINGLLHMSIVQTHVSRLIAARKQKEYEAFRVLATNLQKEAWVVSLLMAASLGAVLPWFVGYFHRPLLELNLWALAVMMPTAVIRTGADAMGAILYALNLDRTQAVIAAWSFVTSVLLIGCGAWVAGFAGVVWAYLGVSLTVLSLRARHMRPTSWRHVASV
jgi:O-antigen/teichoic acid export membrane protein